MMDIKIIAFLFVFLLNSSINSKGQNIPNTTLEQTNENLLAQANEKSMAANDLRKQASAKKAQAAKEKNATTKTTLQSDAAKLEIDAKQKITESNALKKQAADLKKQQKIFVNSNAKLPGLNNTNEVINNLQKKEFIEIYEQPAYQGKKSVYYINSESFDVHLPFSSNNISIKFSNEDKLIVYLVEDDGINQSIKTVINSTPNYSIVSNNIATIRVGTKVKLDVNFNGIIYSNPVGIYGSPIHNNDCKKLYGNFSYKIILNLRGREPNAKAETELINPYTGIIGSSVNMFNLQKNADNVCSYIYSSQEANLTEKSQLDDGIRHSFGGRSGFYGRSDDLRILTTIPNIPFAKQTYVIDSALYEFNKRALFMKVDVFIGSAHKSCDVCTDFTWDAAMKEKDAFEIPLPNEFHQMHNRNNSDRRTFDFLQIGPFRRKSINSRVVPNFIGPEHPTFIQLTTQRIYN